MKRLSTQSSSLLLTLAALVVALALGACSKSGVDSIAGPSHDGAVAFAKGPGNGGNVPPPPPPAPPPPAAADPCVSLTGFSATVVPVLAEIPQNRTNRLRVEITGDVAATTINKLGACSSGLTPAVTFTTARGTVVGSGGINRTVSVTSLLQVPGEPGVLVGTDAAGNVLEIIWPGLAGDVPGPPILRMQFVTGAEAGRAVSVTMSFTARTANGATATFSASAANLIVPALR
jgi:hypothetical protein